MEIILGLNFTREISTILIINALKWWRSVGNGNSRLMQRFEYGGTFKLNSDNCKKTKKNKKQKLKCLPNLQETLIKVQSFHSICLKIGVKVNKVHPVERN